MTRVSRILILLGQVIFLRISIIISQNMTCPFKYFFSIPCPLCGLTRSLNAILKGNIKLSIYYNVLLLPTLIIILFLNIIFLIEVIKNKPTITNKIINLTYQNKKKIVLICLIMLIFSTIINLYHRI